MRVPVNIIGGYLTEYNVPAIAAVVSVRDPEKYIGYKVVSSLKELGIRYPEKTLKWAIKEISKVHIVPSSYIEHLSYAAVAGCPIAYRRGEEPLPLDLMVDMKIVDRININFEKIFNIKNEENDLWDIIFYPLIHSAGRIVIKIAEGLINTNLIQAYNGILFSLGVIDECPSFLRSFKVLEDINGYVVDFNIFRKKALCQVNNITGTLRLGEILNLIESYF